MGVGAGVGEYVCPTGVGAFVGAAVGANVGAALARSFVVVDSELELADPPRATPSGPQERWELCRRPRRAPVHEHAVVLEHERHWVLLHGLARPVHEGVDEVAHARALGPALEHGLRVARALGRVDDLRAGRFRGVRRATPGARDAPGCRRWSGAARAAAA